MNDQSTDTPGSQDTAKFTMIACFIGNHKGLQVVSQAAGASGCITTFNKFTQAYGYVEARIQTPTCKGAWPAFWMLPNRGPAYGAAAVDNTGQRSWFTVSGQPNGAEIAISWKASAAGKRRTIRPSRTRDLSGTTLPLPV